MKFAAFVSLFLISGALAASTNKSTRAADACDAEVCSGGSCYCSGSSSPLELEETPQFVILTFTDAVTDLIHTDYLLPMLDGRVNPDGNQVGATFFVPHEYTDYEAVNDLYNIGLEIGVHSITKNSQISYWSDASVETLVEEFQGQREIVSRFANIPIEDIIGARIPNLEMSGDKMIEAYIESSIEYDNSWVSLSSSKFFPYTLDYLSTQRCNIGTCPTESHPGFFTMPLINIQDQDNIECNSLQGCGVTGTVAEVRTWLVEQFESFYTENRAPMTIAVTSAWFASTEDGENFDGFLEFLDYLRDNYSDVFLVSHKQLLQWMKNPVAASEYQTPVSEVYRTCGARTCDLVKEGEEERRYMKSCVNCPTRYPWVGNPQGN